MKDILYGTGIDFCSKCRKFFPDGTVKMHLSSNGKIKVMLCPSCVDISKKGLKKQLLSNKQKYTAK